MLGYGGPDRYVAVGMFDTDQDQVRIVAILNQG